MSDTITYSTLDAHALNQTQHDIIHEQFVAARGPRARVIAQDLAMAWQGGKDGWHTEANELWADVILCASM